MHLLKICIILSIFVSVLHTRQYYYIHIYFTSILSNKWKKDRFKSVLRIIFLLRNQTLPIEILQLASSNFSFFDTSTTVTCNILEKQNQTFRNQVIFRSQSKCPCRVYCIAKKIFLMDFQNSQTCENLFRTLSNICEWWFFLCVFVKMTNSF